MGRIEDLTTGELQELRWDHLIGSSPAADLRIGHRTISSEHARIHWTGRAWLLRDLGTRNGTWAGHRRLGPGESVALFVDARFSFGQPTRSFRLVDGGGPSSDTGP